MNNRKSKFLNPSEVLSELGISYPTLLRMVKRGDIPCVRVGNALRFPRSYFDKLELKAFEGLNDQEEQHG